MMPRAAALLAVAAVACASPAIPGARTDTSAPSGPPPLVLGHSVKTVGDAFLVLAATADDTARGQRGLWRVSADARTWQRLVTIPGPMPSRLTAWAADGDAILVTRDSLPALWSGDAGRTWQRVRPPANGTAGIHAGDGLWVAIDAEGWTWRSNDAGRRWRRLETKDPRINDRGGELAIAGGRLFTTIADYLVTSVDTGRTWVLPSSAAPQPGDRAGSAPRWLGVRARRGLHVSVDGGATWTPREFPFVEGALSPVGWSVRNGRVAVVLPRCGVAESEDAGRTWTPMHCRAAWQEFGSDPGVVATTGATTLYLDVASGRSMVRDAADGWRVVTEGARTPPPLRHLFAHEGTLYAVGANGTILASADSGRSWQSRLPFIGSALPDLRFVGRDGGRLVALAAGAREGDLQSRDGQRWSEAREIPAGASAVVRGRRATIWMRGTSLPALRRVDGDSAWTPLGLGPGITVEATDSALVAIVGEGVIVRSEDDGATWQRVSASGHHSLQAIGPNELAVRTTGALLSTRDHGRTWRTLGTPPYAQRTQRFVRSGSALIAIGSRDIMRSVDDGRTWSASDVPGWDLHDIWSSGDIVVAVGTRRIIRSTDAGASWRDVPCCSLR